MNSLNRRLERVEAALREADRPPSAPSVVFYIPDNGRGDFPSLPCWLGAVCIYDEAVGPLLAARLNYAEARRK